MTPTLILAFTAGMVGAMNPCGFSLLPAYVGSFVSGDSANGPLDRRLLRAVWSATAVTVGFVVVVFVILGVALSSVEDRIRGQLPWVTMVIGATLALAGMAVVGGRRLPMPDCFPSSTMSVPCASERWCWPPWQSRLASPRSFRIIEHRWRPAMIDEHG